MKPALAALVLLAGAAGAAVAQAPSPYGAFASRAIKALSAEELADLEAGRGMGLSLAAELNGYPGPLHVLELADALALTPAQRDASAALVAPMRARAQTLGRAIIAAEAELERALAAHAIDAEGVRAFTARIAALRGELRAVHLETHLAQRAVLRPAQIARYGELRGYGAAPVPAEPQHQRHHR